MSAPCSVFMVHFAVFAWVPSPMKMSNISYFFTYFFVAASVLDELLFIDITWRDRVPQEDTGRSIYCHLNLRWKRWAQVWREDRIIWKAVKASAAAAEKTSTGCAVQRTCCCLKCRISCPRSPLVAECIELLLSQVYGVFSEGSTSCNS